MAAPAAADSSSSSSRAWRPPASRPTKGSTAGAKAASRRVSAPSKGPDDQAHGFTALALPPEYELYSKAGWTSTARHDAAYVASPDSKLKFVLVTFTTGHANQREIIAGVAKSVMEQLREGARPSEPR